MAIPSFIEPMLCKPGEPFDSDEHLFEIKWDGIRLLCFVDSAGKYRLVNRRQVDCTERYPELDFLGKLPAGTILDGEIVVLKDGKPDFALVMSRESSRKELRARTLSRSTPATYIVFDLLYVNGTNVMNLPLVERRQLLAEVVKIAPSPYFLLSQGIEGHGQAYFAEAVKQGLEGVVAKKLTSKYEPGRRTGAWTKIKRGSELLCAIIGFVPDGKDFRSLILAAEVDGTLRYVGKVGTGLTDAQHKWLNETMRARIQKKPAVACPIKGKWIEPGLFCRVSFLEMSENGELRMPVLEELTDETG
ncbi:MAG: non-homologous end-joining DNA ligase [Gemmataceae bacterium]